MTYAKTEQRIGNAHHKDHIVNGSVDDKLTGNGGNATPNIYIYKILVNYKGLEIMHVLKLNSRISRCWFHV